MINIIRSGASPQEIFITLIALISSAMLSIIVHEYAHGYIALKNGDPTAKMMGRLTFNPAKHFDLLGLLMFLLIGFGWAKPVPINSNNFTNYKKGVVTTSLAGIIANFILAFLMFGMSLAILGIAKVSNLNNQFVFILLKLLYNFFYLGTIINITLMAFNILPIYPLDGFRVVEVLTKPDNGYVVFMRKYGTYVLLGILIISSFVPRLDILSLYFMKIQEWIIGLFKLIFGGAVGLI